VSDRWLIPEIKTQELLPVRDNLVPFAATEMYKRHEKVQEVTQDPAFGPARKDLMPFIKMTFPTYVDEEFHRDVCKYIQKVVIPREDGTREIDRLMLFAPPQHGKSEIVSTRLPGFWLAKNPELPVALISYGGHLAFRNSRNARAVLNDPTFTALFPECVMDPGNWRQEDWHVWGHKGYCVAAGVDGPLTGHGFGLAVIDDPIESWAKAQSDTERENAWSWYDGTFRSRMWEHGAVILMQTRWHEDDLAGRILAREGRVEKGGRWTVISYKALAEKDDVLGRQLGEALCPSRFSREYLEGIRENMSAQAWWAQYQQTPIQPEGNWFKIGRVKIVESVPAEVAEVQARVDADPVIVNIHRGMRFWDLAGTEKKEQKQDPDYTVGTLLVVYKGSTYVLDVVRGRHGPEDVWNLLASTAKTDGKKARVRIEQEPGQSGKAQIAAFVKMLQGYDVQGVPASGDKIIRTDPFAAQLNAGNVYVLKASWNREWLAELSNFPFGKHDDQVMSVATGYSTEVTEQKFRAATFAHL
jgi:predicted phage terminase large subunit-like protein